MAEAASVATWTLHMARLGFPTAQESHGSWISYAMASFSWSMSSESQGGSGKAFYDLAFRSHTVSPLLDSIGYTGPTQIHWEGNPRSVISGAVAHCPMRYL